MVDQDPARLVADVQRAQKIERRLARLEKMKPTVDAASIAIEDRLRSRSAPPPLRLRGRFVCRTTPAPVPARRRLPAKKDRPPAARIISPRGLALRFELVALFEAQQHTRAGEKPSNPLHLIAPDERTGWVDLIAVPPKPPNAKPAKRYVPKAEVKQAQIVSALKALAKPEVRLVDLPHLEASHGKYQGFVLLDEGGVRKQGEPAPYQVPAADEPDVFEVPADLFTRGWIHVLEDSELLLLLMLMHQRRQGTRVEPVTRHRYYGLGWDSYEAHMTLEYFGLLKVNMQERYDHGRIVDYDGIPETHHLTLLRDGFDELAVSTMIAALSTRPGRRRSFNRSRL